MPDAVMLVLAVAVIATGVDLQTTRRLPPAAPRVVLGLLSVALLVRAIE